MPTGFRVRVEQAERYLQTMDPALGQIIENLGPENWDNYQQQPLKALIRAVIGQQLSTKAARAIEGRVLALLPESIDTWPTALLNRPAESLRSAGLSRAKIRTLKTLAEQVHDDPQGFAGLDNVADEQVREKLCLIPGIGPWTVDMFLMFGLNRLDVFSGRDLGLRKAMGLHLEMDCIPTATECDDFARRWKPYRTVAAWHLWRLVD